MTVVVATSKYFINLGALSEAAVTDIARHYKLSGDPATVIQVVREMLLGSTYAEIEPIFDVLREIAVKHGHTEQVKPIPFP